MRAFAITRFGDSPIIRDVPKPTTENGAFVARVLFAGVNPVDYKSIDRLTVTSTFPFILGADFAGVIEEVPAGSTEFRVGDRVFGIARTSGAYAEYAAVTPGKNSEPFTRIPDGVTDEQAAALPIPALTALGSLDMLDLQSGQKIVILGGAGAVGGFAIEIAKSREAIVIATVRGSVDEAVNLGADVVFDSERGNIYELISSEYPDGVDAVLDLISPKDAIHQDAKLLKPGGKLVSTIYAADEDWFADRNIAAMNIVGNTNPLFTPQGLTSVAKMVQEGVITPRIRTVVNLDSAAAILEKLKNGGLHGKALIQA